MIRHSTSIRALLIVLMLVLVLDPAGRAQTPAKSSPPRQAASASTPTPGKAPVSAKAPPAAPASAAAKVPSPPPAATAAKPVDRKTLTFQPGAKAPDQATPPPAAMASATPVPSLVRKPTGDECLDLAGVFFDSLKQSRIDDAYANLTKGSKIGDRPEELRNLKQKTSEAIALFGEIRGFEVIENKAVGTTLRRYTIVSFGRDFPLRWRFYFYKVDNQWRLVDLHVDDRLNSIFAEDVDTPAEPKR